MWNVLVLGRQRPAILDWESAAAEALPLVDLYYALADAAAAAGDYRHPFAAFLECYGPAGKWRGLAAGLERRVAASLALPADYATLCFHACWLGHAADEEERAIEAGRRRFLPIVQWLAAHRPERLDGGDG
jgi:hypothetical protein